MEVSGWLDVCCKATQASSQPLIKPVEEMSVVLGVVRGFRHSICGTNVRGDPRERNTTR